MSNYVTGDWYSHLSRATATIHDDTKTFRVTYRGDDGKAFRVKVHQKPNPIGFRAQLPGDRKGK